MIFFFSEHSFSNDEYDDILRYQIENIKRIKKENANGNNTI